MKKSDSIEAWQTARALFEHYLDKPITQAVDEIIKDNEIPTKVKSKLIKLIKSQSQSDTLIENPDLSFFSSINTTQEDLSGKSIAEYKLISRIGTGGMSNVYKAKRKDTEIQKFVALKLINTNVSENLKVLFKREQQTLSKLNHPNIISFHHGGISKSGIPFLVMDYIEDAQDIKDYVITNKLANNQIVRLIQKVADAISFAHQNFIIHKDIKPNNILLDKLGVPRVVDFGIAMVLEDEKKENQYIFTPDYASPEQINGEYIAPNSDVFSLSAVLLELLTNEKPLAFFEIGHYKPDADTKHVNELLDKSQLEPDLKNILIRGLQSNSSNRYQSMSDFNQDLGNWLDNKPVMATDKSLQYVARKFIQRHFVSSLAILALVASIIVSMFLVIQQKNHAQFEAVKAQQVTDFLINAIQASDPDTSKGKEVSVIELLQNAKIKVQESSFDDLQLATALKQTIGSALAKVGEYQDAEKLLLQVVDSKTDNFKARINLAGIYLQQQMFDKVGVQLQSLMDNYNNLTIAEKIQTIQIEAEILSNNGLFEQAIKKIQEAIDIQNKNPELLIKSKLALVKILNDSGNTKKSIDILRDTLVISEKTFGEISTASTNILMLLANTLSSGRDSKKEEIYDLYIQTIENQKLLYRKYHPVIAKTYLQYGFALRAFGDLDSALENALKAREIALINYDENHMLTAHIDLLLSQIKLRKGDIDGAIIQLKNVVKVYALHYGENHFETNQTKTTLSLYLMTANKTQQALGMLLPLYETQKQQLGEFNKATLYVKLNIIKANNLLGNSKDSVKDGIRTLANSRKHLGKENIISIGLQMVLVQSQLIDKNYDAAVELCQELLTYDLIINHPVYNKSVSDLLLQAQKATP